MFPLIPSVSHSFPYISYFQLLSYFFSTILKMNSVLVKCENLSISFSSIQYIGESLSDFSICRDIKVAWSKCCSINGKYIGIETTRILLPSESSQDIFSIHVLINQVQSHSDQEENKHQVCYVIFRMQNDKSSYSIEAFKAQ